MVYLLSYSSFHSRNSNLDFLQKLNISIQISIRVNKSKLLLKLKTVLCNCNLLLCYILQAMRNNFIKVNFLYNE